MAKTQTPKAIKTSMKGISTINAPNRSSVEKKYPHKRAAKEVDNVQSRPSKH